MKRIYILLISLLLLNNVAIAQQYKLTKSVMGCGGSLATDGIHKLNGSVSQVAAGSAQDSKSQLQIGFWPQKKEITGIEACDGAEAICLGQNYPNPFSRSTTIEFSLMYQDEFELSILNLLGEKIYTIGKGIGNQGNNKLVFSDDIIPSGIYFYQLSANNKVLTKILVIIK